MTKPFTFNTVARNHIGVGAVSGLTDICHQLQVTTPLLITDKGIVACDLLAQPLAAMRENGLAVVVFDDVQADPPESNVSDALALAKSKHCDGVIGFGGGSSMDVAKLVSALMASDQPLQAMYGVDMVTGGRAPLIQVPTTAGTGSEATAVAIITTGESSKAGVVSPTLLADHIILDAQLTVGLPPHVSAATGIDAMVHAIEAYTSVRLKNPLSDMAALKALALLSNSIETVVSQGDKLQAREDMLLGAMLAGQAFANAPVAAVHALAYPLGGTYHIAHGLSNSLMLPHVLRFNAPHCADLYLELADVIAGVNTKAATPSNVGDVLADHFYQLASRLGLATRLRDMQINEDALPSLAEQAMEQQRLLINNPRTVDYADALSLYEQAF